MCHVVALPNKQHTASSDQEATPPIPSTRFFLEVLKVHPLSTYEAKMDESSEQLFSLKDDYIPLIP